MVERGGQEEDVAGRKMLERLNLSYVRRWAIAPTFRDQSVAEHTFRVMVIAYYLADRVYWPDHAADYADYMLMMAVMDHDLDEVYTGDLPGPDKDKKGTSGLRDLTLMTPIECLIKVADSIETGTFWVQWGNGAAWNHRYANAPQRDLDKISHYGSKIPGLTEVAMEVWKNVIARSKQRAED